MSLFKRAAAASAALLMTLSLASCGKDTVQGAVIDGVEIPAGIFILYQSNALSEAYSQLSDQLGESDDMSAILDLSIEDEPVTDWVNDKAIENMKKYAAYETKFDELGLSFQNNEDKIVTSTAEQWWEYIGEQYEGYGISEQSYIDAGVNSRKGTAIFEYYYGKGGEKEVPEEDIKNYLTENNARIKYIEMTLKDAEGNVLKSEDKEDVKKMADEYIERLKGGESFDTIEDEYASYVDALSASEDETAEGEDVIESEDISEKSEETSESADAETEEAPDYGTVIAKDSSVPAASVAEKSFDGSINVGDYVLVEDYEAYYIVNKLDLFADPEYLENSSDTALHALKDEEFDEMVSGWLTEQNAQINQAAVERYKLDKLV